MSDVFKIAVLISGGGTTLKNLIDLKENNRLLADIVHVISSNARARGNEYAERHSIPLTVVQRKSHLSDEDFSKKIFDICSDAGVDLVVMGGFLKRVKIPEEYENRVINIHPSLIPAFSGKGFYGSRVHQAVVDYGCRISGCTVHFVDDHYDHGPIIAQRSLDVDASDDAISLANRVFELECQVYPEVINSIARGQVSVNNRQVSLNAS